MFLSMCQDVLPGCQLCRFALSLVFESTDISVFPAEVVDAKTSLEESPVAVDASFSVGHL